MCRIFSYLGHSALQVCFLQTSRPLREFLSVSFREIYEDMMDMEDVCVCGECYQDTWLSKRLRIQETRHAGIHPLWNDCACFNWPFYQWPSGLVCRSSSDSSPGNYRLFWAPSAHADEPEKAVYHSVFLRQRDECISRVTDSEITDDRLILDGWTDEMPNMPNEPLSDSDLPFTALARPLAPQGAPRGRPAEVAYMETIERDGLGLTAQAEQAELAAPTLHFGDDYDEQDLFGFSDEEFVPVTFDHPEPEAEPCTAVEPHSECDPDLESNGDQSDQSDSDQPDQSDGDAEGEPDSECDESSPDHRFPGSVYPIVMQRAETIYNFLGPMNINVTINVNINGAASASMGAANRNDRPDVDLLPLP